MSGVDGDFNVNVLVVTSMSSCGVAAVLFAYLFAEVHLIIRVAVYLYLSTHRTYLACCLFRRLDGGLMILVFFKYPHLLDEEPGLGDLKTTDPNPSRQDGYVRDVT